MEKAYKLEFKPERTNDFILNCCGCSKTEPLHSFGPAVRPYYLIHYILSGKGKFVVGGKTYQLEKGYGFLIEPDELTFYQADEDDPWSYVWVGFTGSLAADTVAQMGLSMKHPIYASDKGEEIYQVVKDMIEHNTIGTSNDLRRNGLLAIFLSLITESSAVNEKEDIDKGNQYVQKAVQFIQGNYCNPIKITDVADFVCINRSYLYTLFQKYMNISPQQFLSIFRITKAAELLQVTNLTIESIGFSCGYTDPLVFAKAFRQIHGMSPSTYRKSVLADESRKPTDLLAEVETIIQQTKI